MYYLDTHIYIPYRTHEQASGRGDEFFGGRVYVCLFIYLHTYAYSSIKHTYAYSSIIHLFTYTRTY